MANDLEIGVKLKADFEDWKNTAKSVPGLTEAQQKNVQKGMDMAEKALNAKDWEVFSKQFNKVTLILTQAIAATGNISEALQRALDLKKKIDASINLATDRISQIKSKYADDKMSAFTKQGASKNFNDWTKTNGNIKSAAGQNLGRDESASRLEEALRLTNGSLNKLTDELAKQAGFGSRQDAFKANRYFKAEEQTRLGDIKEINSLNKTIEQDQIDLKEVDDEIARLEPVSKKAAAGLEELYKKLVQLSGALNADVTQQKSDDRLARKEAEGGGAASSPDFNTGSKALDKQSNSLGKVFKQFTLYSVVLRMAKRAMHEAIKTVKELDKALTEQAMVTGLTRQQTYQLLETYQHMAGRLGTTTKEVASTMTQFLRQGRSINESLQLSEAAISAAKVAGISAADSINYLTTAINGFRLSAEDAMKVSDKFAAVAATAATSYEEIAIALSKVAAQANLAGMSIDYTTALLTKGIETTREAPETIGTALKTVIARMRELGDYGETLGGDTDINNVESQLAYIGIALRDNNGELRSTEDVLNDLGKQWDDLNANQQAAIAKALAGTRQQSRLIAMMSDYERVIELQQIAERSEGATVAQMATYLEGMDAALNRVNNAWEQIVANLVNNEGIINFINYISGFLQTIADFLSTDWGVVTTLTIIGGLAVTALGTKLQEMAVAKAQQLIANDNLATALKKRQVEIATLITNKKSLLFEKGQTIEDKKQLALTRLKKKQEDGLLSDAEYNAQVAQINADAAKDQATLKAEIATLTEEELANEAQLTQLGQTSSATWSTISSTVAVVGGGILSLITGSQTWLVIMTAVGLAFKAIPPIIKTIAALNKVRLAKEKGEEQQKTFIQMAGAATGLGVPGLIIAAALMAMAGIAAVATLIGAAINSKDKEVDKVNSISKEIFDFSKKASTLNSVINKFDILDSKILKTNKDLEEMKSLLDSAADSLDEGEKNEYNSRSTIEGKAAYLREVAQNTRDNLDSKRNELKDTINEWKKNGGESWQDFLTSSETEYANARASVYTLNNVELQKYIDNLKESTDITDEAASATEHLVQSLIEQYKIKDALKLMNNPQLIDEYAEAISTVTSSYTNKKGDEVKGNAAEILQSEDYSITERIQAYKALEEVVNTLDDNIIKAFYDINKEWQTFSHMSKETWAYIDKIGANIDGINDLATAIQELGYNVEDSAKKVNEMFSLLQAGGNLKNTIIGMFGEDNLDAIVNAYDKAFGTTILNMGQNVDKFKNTINSFYEKAQDWATMSETDKTSFISENAGLFEGKDGAELLKAFESGNYNAIASALAANEALVEQRKQLLKDVNEQLTIELSRSDKKRNEAYIKELQEYKRQLEDVNKVYLASLKLRYEQQQAQLDMYKDMLKKETDALTDALNKRKEAYQKYFDTINQKYEDIEYEEKAQTLIANISKLSSSNNADARAKIADLERQWQELEKERLKELRQRAQEEVIKGIEDEVTKISDNLEKLLNNEQALLNAMIKDADNPSELIASLVSAQFANGNNTELGMQTYLQQMQSTFASMMPNVDWSNVDVERRGDSLILNIMGREIQLTNGEQQTIYDAIQQALKQLGYN